MDSPGGEHYLQDDGLPNERGGNSISNPTQSSFSNLPQNNEFAFPMRLHEMIHWVENKYRYFLHHIKWSSSGHAFMIQDPDAMASR